MGRYEEGYSQMQEGMAIWLRLGDPHSIAIGLNYLAPALVKLGCHTEAEMNLEKSLELCRQSGNRWGMGTAYRYLGQVKMEQGKLDEAKTLLQTSIETFGDYVIGWDIAKSSIYLAEAIRLAGDAAQAQRVYVEALGLAQQAQSVPLRLEALAGVAQLFLEMGNHERAFEISSFVLGQPSGTFETHDRAARVEHLARTCLDAGQVRAMSEKLRGQTLESITDTLI
ncbi:MAG TPA: tetratricopeptide repeat protein [Anaerolineales bacterium]|nr:tetratricopeptide repeat protein [Anaerolineales bacterium]